jgi:hypothetical protein
MYGVGSIRRLIREAVMNMNIYGLKSDLDLYFIYKLTVYPVYSC